MKQDAEINIVTKDNSSPTINKIGNEVKNLNDTIKETNQSLNSVNINTGKIGKNLKIGTLMAGFRKAYNYMKESVKASADYVESLNLLDVAFQGDTRAIREFTNTTAGKLNLDEATLINAAGHFRTLADSMNLSTEAGKDFSQLLTQLNLDLSSLYNVDFDRMQSALQSAVEGQGKSLKQLTGASVLESSVQTQLQALGVDAYVEDMNDSEKAVARLISITYQLQSAQGDLANTIEAPANQMRVMGEQASLLARNVGNILMPILSGLLPILNGILIAINSILGAIAKLVGFKESDFDYVAETSDSYDSLASSIGGVGSAAKSTKKELSGLRGFDKLNVIKTPTESAGGGGGGSGAGTINPKLLKTLSDLLGQYDSKLDGVYTKAQKIADILLIWIKNLTTFDLVSNSVTLDSIKKSIEKIKQSFSEIFSSDKFKQSLQNFVNSTIEYFTKIKDSLFTIGLNAVDGLLGGFSQALSNKKQDIIDDLSRTFDIVAAFEQSMSKLLGSLSDISIVFTKDNFKGVTESIWSLIYEAFSNPYQIALQFAQEIVDTISKVITDNKDKITKALDGWFGNINNVSKPMKESITGIFDDFWKVYDKKLKPAITNFQNYLSDIVGTILNVYNTHIQPVLDELSKKIGEIWTQYIQPIISNIIDIVGEVILVMSKLYDQYLKPVIEWTIANVVPILITIGAYFVDKIINRIKLVLGFIGELIGTLKGVVTFISGILSGDMDKALEGIKQIFESKIDAVNKTIDIIKDTFKNVFDTIVGLFSGFVEAVRTKIELIKNFYKDLIDKLKENIQKIPSWVKEKFENAVENIKNVLNGLPTFISDLWEKIKEKFGELGQKIGDTVGSKFKGAINSALKFIEKALNKPIDSINTLLSKVNAITGGKIGKISRISLPRLEGGGLPPVGQMFIANERGPELVGQIGGQSFVANQNQMMDIIDKKLQNAGGGIKNATFIVQVGNTKVGQVVLNDLQQMAKDNGKPIKIGV